MSRTTDTITALVDLWGGQPDVDVIDGPFITGAEPEQRIYVGYDGDPEGEWLSASTDQSWAGTLGTKRRDETITVTCSAQVSNGGGDIKAAREAAFDVFEAAAAAVHADPSLGFPPPTVAQVRNPQLHYAQTSNVGVVARVAFEVEVSTRI